MVNAIDKGSVLQQTLFLCCPRPRPAPAPTLREFTCFTTAHGRVNLAERISNYWDFGLQLLEDDNGDQITAIERELGRSAVDINRQIFRLWVQENGRQPVTWATLVAVLRDIKLMRLAREIETAVAIQIRF